MIICSDKQQECNKTSAMIIKTAIIKHGLTVHYQLLNSSISHMFIQLLVREAARFILKILRQVGLILLESIKQQQGLLSFNSMVLRA